MRSRRRGKMQPCNGLIGFPCLDASHRGTELAMMQVRSFGLMLGTAMLLAIPVLAALEGADRMAADEPEPEPPALATGQAGTVPPGRQGGAGLVPAASAVAAASPGSAAESGVVSAPRAAETMQHGRVPEARRIRVDKL